MDETTRHTIKISTEALKALRWLAVYQEKRQHVIVEALILAAWKQAEQERTTQKGPSVCSAFDTPSSCS
jgi:hypothetical protein